MILNTRLKLERAMDEATSYAEWAEAAEAHDRTTDAADWKESDESKHFDHESIRRRLDRLSKLWKKQDNKGLLYALNEGIHGNMDGMGNERLFHKAKFGTKQLIQEYVDAITNSLEYLASDKVTDISFDEKLDFFRRAQHCYGRSALLMSGSGAYLYFHVGVVKALWEEGLLPHIMSGSSGGSMVGAMVSTHSDDEIPNYFDPDHLLRPQDTRFKETRLGLIKTKAIDPDDIYDGIAPMIPDLTFQEAYELTGRHLNVSIAPAEKHQTSRLLNAIASPNVYIREAVLASCAVPGVFPAISLMAKNHKGKKVPYLPNRKWVDGSVSDDLPSKRLARLYGVNHHIVSQANPLVTPFASDVTRPNNMLRIIRNASVSSGKAWLNAGAALFQRPLSHFPSLNSTVSITLALVNQNYSGDINIVRPSKYIPLSQLLGPLPKKLVAELIDMGERTTWPKIEMIRTQTKISQALEQILLEYDDELAHDHDAALKRKYA